MIDEINDLYLDYIQTNNFYDQPTPELIIFNKLIDFIRTGDYTNRRNKKVILNFWTKYSNKELADRLNLTVSTISYAKRDINIDLMNSLGENIVTLLKNRQFEKVNRIIDSETKYLSQGIMFPSELLRKINDKYKEDLNKCGHINQDTMCNLTNQLVDGSTRQLPEVDQALHLLHQFFLPRVLDTIEYYNIWYLQPMVEILFGTAGTAEARRALLEILETPSEFELDMTVEYTNTLLDNFQ